MNEAARTAQKHQIRVAIHNPGPNGEPADPTKEPDEIRDVTVYMDERGELVEDAEGIARIEAMLGAQDGE